MRKSLFGAAAVVAGLLAAPASAQMYYTFPQRYTPYPSNFVQGAQYVTPASGTYVQGAQYIAPASGTYMQGSQHVTPASGTYVQGASVYTPMVMPAGSTYASPYSGGVSPSYGYTTANGNVVTQPYGYSPYSTGMTYSNPVYGTNYSASSDTSPTYSHAPSYGYSSYGYSGTYPTYSTSSSFYSTPGLSYSLTPGTSVGYTPGFGAWSNTGRGGLRFLRR